MSAFAGYPQLVSAFLLHNYCRPVIYVLGAKSQSQPAQQAFPCGLGTKNEEQESKTALKMAQVKERAGGGEERKFPSFPSPSPPLSFSGIRFISRAAKAENPVPRPRSFFSPKSNRNACYAGYHRAGKKLGRTERKTRRSLFFLFTSL